MNTKAFSLFLSLYILLLGVLPCFCADEHRVADGCSCEVVEQGDGDHSIAGDADLCSPFCTNHCCIHASLVFQSQQPTSCRPFYSPVKVSVYSPVNACLKGFYRGVWRPPVAK